MNVQNARAIFAEAIALTSAAERRALLDRSCLGDAALRAEVESLLAAHERAGDFLVKTASCVVGKSLCKTARVRLIHDCTRNLGSNCRRQS